MHNEASRQSRHNSHRAIPSLHISVDRTTACVSLVTTCTCLHIHTGYKDAAGANMGDVSRNIYTVTDITQVNIARYGWLEHICSINIFLLSLSTDILHREAEPEETGGRRISSLHQFDMLEYHMQV